MVRTQQAVNGIDGWWVMTYWGADLGNIQRGAICDQENVKNGQKSRKRHLRFDFGNQYK
jgi:hypothetical protein